LYAGVRPERVARLISLEGFGLPRTPAEHAPERYAKWLEQLRAGPQPSRYDSIELLAAHLRQRNARLPEENAGFIAGAWMQRRESGLPRMHFDPFHRYVNPVLHRREEAEACWHRVEADTLLVLATESEYRRRLDHEGDVERMHRCFRRLAVEDLQGLGHMMHHEDPARVADVIFRWWSSRRA
jgi:pimeloyl-ACP methyl ester carboxylesterase